MTTIVADFETTTPVVCEEKVWVYLANWMYLFDSEEQDHISFSISEFFADIGGIDDTEIKCYFHNGGVFDLQFLLNYLIRNLGYKQVKNKRDIWKVKNTFYVLEDTTRIYELMYVWNNKKFIFRDSILLLGSSISDLGKYVGMEKLDLDYDIAYKPDRNYTQVEIGYIHNDVAILRRALVLHCNFWGDLNSLSIAGQCFRKFKSINKENNLYLSISDFEKFKHWYHGGMVTYKTQFANRWLLQKVYVYDINSSYPSSQVVPQPCGQPLKEKPKTGLYTCFYRIFIHKAKIKDRSWPPVLRKQIGLVGDNPTDYIYEGECFYLYVIEEEFEWYKKFYDMEYEILETWYFECKQIFKDLIIKMYSRKVQAKMEGRKSDEFLCKKAINSMYGKYAQRPYFEQICYWNDSEYEKAKKDHRIVIYGCRNENSNIGKKKAYVVYPASKANDKANYIPIACDVTSTARCKLLKAIWENKENFLYCDTDSIFLTAPAKGLKISDYGLGDWKLECEGEGINFLQAKFYRIIDKNGTVIKQAHAGVKENAINAVSNDKYKLGLEVPMGKLMKVKVDGGVYLIDRTVKIGGNKIDLNISCSGNSSDPTQPLNIESAPNENKAL